LSVKVGRPKGSKNRKPNSKPQDILEMYIEPDMLYPVEHPYHYLEVVGTFNLVGCRPIAYQVGHRFYWKQKKSYFYALTPEVLNAIKPYINKSIFWMPQIDDIIMHAHANGITVSFYHTRKAVHQTYTVLIYDSLLPGKGHQDLLRYASMDVWWCVAHGVARAIRRRIDMKGLDSLTAVIYAEDAYYNVLGLRMTDHEIDEGRQQHAELAATNFRGDGRI
jgi:hypothetical protein